MNTIDEVGKAAGAHVRAVAASLVTGDENPYSPRAALAADPRPPAQRLSRVRVTIAAAAVAVLGGWTLVATRSSSEPAPLSSAVPAPVPVVDRPDASPTTEVTVDVERAATAWTRGAVAQAQASRRARIGTSCDELADPASATSNAGWRVRALGYRTAADQCEVVAWIVETDAGDPPGPLPAAADRDIRSRPSDCPLAYLLLDDDGNYLGSDLAGVLDAASTPPVDPPGDGCTRFDTLFESADIDGDGGLDQSELIPGTLGLVLRPDGRGNLVAEDMATLVGHVFEQ